MSTRGMIHYLSSKTRVSGEFILRIPESQSSARSQPSGRDGLWQPYERATCLELDTSEDCTPIFLAYMGAAADGNELFYKWPICKFQILPQNFAVETIQLLLRTRYRVKCQSVKIVLFHGGPFTNSEPVEEFRR